MHDDINISGSVFDFTYILFVKAPGFKHGYFVPNINISVSSVAEKFMAFRPMICLMQLRRESMESNCLAPQKQNKTKQKKAFFVLHNFIFDSVK